MIRFDLTQPESESLLHWLQTQSQTGLDPSVQQKMVSACQEALQHSVTHLFEG